MPRYVLNTAVNAQEYRKINDAAKKLQMSIYLFLRTAALEKASRVNKLD
jgi:hypothetical protein